MFRCIAAALAGSTALFASACSSRPPNVSPEEMEARIQSREEAIRREAVQHADAVDQANPIGFFHAPAPSLPVAPRPDRIDPLDPRFVP
jgi:hypothetical protein